MEDFYQAWLAESERIEKARDDALPERIMRRAA